MTLSFLFALISSPIGAPGPAQPNILYLMSDDMRPQLGIYGHPWMKTPYLDSLGSTGLVFDSAYTQFAYCAPSRASFLSGRRPDRSLVLNFDHVFRFYPGHENWVTLPQHFKNHGYFTTCAGKLFHNAGAEDPISWSYPANNTPWWQCSHGDAPGINGNFCSVTNNSIIPFTDEDIILEEGLKRMKLAHESGKPWFVGIGVHRPHHSTRLPQGWLGTDLYPPPADKNATNDVVQPPKHPESPVGIPYMSGGWITGDYSDPAIGCPTCIAPADRAVEYRRWYYAGVSYADHMLGKALDYLDELGETNNTITVFHSDHGYQLGELNEWSKKTDTELATRVPLLVRVPWKENAVGKRVKTVRAELIDLYRTLADLAGIAGDIQDGVQGMSLAPLFDDPTSESNADLKAKNAYSQIGSCDCVARHKGNWSGLDCGAGRCIHTAVSEFDFMGYTMRTPEGWRYTAWVPMNPKTERVDWTKNITHELYDLRGQDDANNDFDYDGMSVNVASQNKKLVHTYVKELEAAIKSFY